MFYVKSKDIKSEILINISGRIFLEERVDSLLHITRISKIGLNSVVGHFLNRNDSIQLTVTVFPR